MHTNASCCCTGNWANSLNPSFSISSWRYTDCCWLLFQGPKLSVCSHLWNMGCCFAFQYSAPSPFTCNYFENTQMWIPDTSSTFHSFVVKIVGSLQFCCEVGGRWCCTQCVQSPEVSATGAGTLDFPILARDNLVVHSLVQDPPINICTETSQGIKIPFDKSVLAVNRELFFRWVTSGGIFSNCYIKRGFSFYLSFSEAQSRGASIITHVCVMWCHKP